MGRRREGHLNLKSIVLSGLRGETKVFKVIKKDHSLDFELDSSLYQHFSPIGGDEMKRVCLPGVKEILSQL